ncbi:MAG TPA: AbiH family protein [Vicingaceae bacterium]|nr:AbiH family protein [Vicingaceae bacterium]
MNRLVIVGNGFDLAHELETKYEHFLKDYLIKHIKKSLENDDFSFDELIKVRAINGYTISGENTMGYVSKITIENMIESQYIKWTWRHKRNIRNDNIDPNKVYIEIELQSKLLSSLIGESKWTDIEKTYFDELLEAFKKRNDEGVGKSFKIEKLNNDFKFLRTKIIEYLKIIDKPITNYFDYRGGLFKSVKNPETEYLKKYFGKENDIETTKLDNLFFINFNYTRLLRHSIKQIKQRNPDINVKYFPIHGSLNNPENIIFGYGDDSNKHYQDLEDEDNNEYLKNIKSFYYPNESHYIDLINALYEQEYDVFVFGHSLGLSDRVLLKTIFEHKNCKAIKLFHRGSKESQFSKRIALSRHFTDKIEMRSKIVDYSDEDVI